MVYGLGAVLIIIAGWIIAIALGWGLPYSILVEGLDWLKFNSWEAMAVALILLLVGVLIFFRPRDISNLSFQISSKFGEVRVTNEAIQEIISQGALAVNGVRKIQASLHQREQGLEITVAAQFGAEIVIPEASEELQEKVKRDVEHYAGIKVAEVKVLVRSLEQARLARVK